MKKYICMIAYTTYSIDNRVRREAEALAATGEYVVSVLALKEEQVRRNYRLEGVEVRELNMSKYQGRGLLSYLISYLKFAFIAFYHSNKLLFNKTLDVVHIHNMPNFLVFCGIIPFLSGKKVILDVHDIMLETYLVKFEERAGILKKFFFLLLRLEELISCAFAHKIICTNHLQRDILVKRGTPERKITILLNTPDPRIFSRSKQIETEHNKKKNFKIIYHGTISKRLSLGLAIRAVVDLADRIPSIEFTIVGRGEDATALSELSKDIGGEVFIHFLRPVPGEQLVEILSTMNLGIVPNNRDAATELMLPVKMLECLALGIPVVVPRLKVIEYYFNDNMVTYFEPGNAESLASAILDNYSNQFEKKSKVENTKPFFRKYGWNTHKFDLINLYQSL